jgi:hypothetical protein
LTEVPEQLAETLIGLIGAEAAAISGRAANLTPQTVMQAENADVELWEHHIESTIESNTQLPSTDREALIVARRGQGIFKQRVMQIEHSCRITGVNNPIHLRASHCKPWRDSTNEERLHPENGLLLTPTIDHLFDRGFISFDNSGELILSPVAHLPSLNQMGVATDRIVNVGAFTDGQKHFLEYHRDSVLLRAAR